MGRRRSRYGSTHRRREQRIEGDKVKSLAKAPRQVYVCRNASIGCRRPEYESPCSIRTCDAQLERCTRKPQSWRRRR
eukprot:1784861-Prymnesium_polylepis.1